MYSNYKMEKTWCLKDGDYTPCVEPSGYQRNKRKRLQIYCTCAVCGSKEVRYVKENGQNWNRKEN